MLGAREERKLRHKVSIKEKEKSEEIDNKENTALLLQERTEC